MKSPPEAWYDSAAVSGGDTGIVGCNVQSAVDTKHHLIVAHEVTNVGTDRNQLSGMADAKLGSMVFYAPLT